ncbi:Protein of unknown function [Lactobacillus delbrueckii subsp. lactis]|nr:Protein of unknown function [Lactobacillus delbrueckii subsp. lactis]
MNSPSGQAYKSQRAKNLLLRKSQTIARLLAKIKITKPGRITCR